jgi:hypothetical protein
MYGVWDNKWPENWTPRWEGDYPRTGLVRQHLLRDEAFIVARCEASIAGARRLKAALEAHAPKHAATVPTSTWRKLGI